MSTRSNIALSGCSPQFPRFLLAVIWMFAGLFPNPCHAQSGIPAATEERVLFTNSIVPMPAPIAASVRPVPQAELANTQEIAVPLRMRNYPQLLERIARGNPVPDAEMNRDYLPLPADYAAVVAWLKSEGFTVTHTDPRRLSVFARGAVTQIQKSLQVEMVQVTADSMHYHAARSHPSLPTRIAAPVLGINGLQPFLRLKKHQAGPLPQTANRAPFLVNEIMGAYNGRGMGLTGAGQKIAIVIDTVADGSDLTSFWTANSVSQSLANIEVVNVNSVGLPAPTGEETLDEEWSSGVAPGARIRVYAAGDIDYISIDKALQQIVSDVSGSNPAQPQLHQVSISLGEGETYLLATSQMQTDSQYMASLANAGVSVFVSSGDSGSNPNDYGSGGGPLQAEYYASDPNVTGVGGTSLTLDSITGNVSIERGWSGSGGGLSQYFSRPSWQVGSGVPAGSMRSVPDVSLVADPNTGAYVYLGGSVQTIGGTSWSAPAWAGFCALINEARAKASLPPIGLLNPKIYPLLKTSNFRDITSGNNGHYTAAAGYDNVTGIGVPNLANLIPSLSSTAPVISSFFPASGWIGLNVQISGMNLSSASQVQFNGIDASSFTVNSDSQITATVPVNATTGPVTVTTPVGTGTSAINFVIVSGTATTAVYSTGFETPEGYSTFGALAGQQGWQVAGSGGNGLMNGIFQGQGNQAYIGLSSPNSGVSSESLWQPINYTPLTGDVITFSVQMDIIDSTNNHYDHFQWCVDNIAGNTLFTIDFNNYTNAISYILDSNVSSNNSSGTTLSNGTIYTLQVTLDFPHNTWSATLNGAPFASNHPITTWGADLTLGGIKAKWALRDSQAGDNYMLFDNYQITRTAPTGPAVTTNSATGVTYSGATLNGSVNPRGLSAMAWFRYWNTSSSGTTPIQNISAGTTTTPLSATLAGLTPRTLYHSQLVASSSGGTVQGVDQTFTTGAPPPSATTGAASLVTDIGATLNGTVNPNGLATTCHFEYGGNTSYGLSTAPQNAGAGAAAVSVAAAINPLTVLTTYHYRLVAVNASGTSNGSDSQFTSLAGANATLSALTLNNATFAPAFSPAGTVYSGTVSNSVTSVTVTPTTSDSNATVAVRMNGGAYSTIPSGTPSSALPLNVGANTINVTTTAQNGTTVKTVTITVVRLKSANADLSSLALSGATLSPTFGPGTLGYSGTVPSSVTAVTATTADSGATIRVQVNAGVLSVVGSGTASGPLPLKLGANSVNVKVTAANGTTVNTYTITVTRIPSSNADLSNLSLSTTAISPGFARGTMAYTASIANVVAGVTVTATKADPGATISLQVNGGLKTALSSNSASAAQKLTLATNTIIVNVTAEDKVTTNSYTIIVSRVTPPVITPPAVGSVDAVLNATVDPRSTRALFQYGLTSAYGTTTSSSPTTSGSVSTLVTGLDPATIYHYRAAVTTGSQVDYSSPDATFLTSPAFPAAVVRDTIVPQLSGSAFKFVAFGAPALDDPGHTAFQATISGTAVAAIAYPALFVDTGTAGSLFTIAKAGQAAPDGTGITGTTGIFATMGDPVFNNNDALAFLGTLKTGVSGVTTANDLGIWANTSGTLALVAREGQTLSTPASAKFASFAQLVLPDTGGPVFLANLAIGPGGITAKNSQGIWAADASGSLTLLVRTGDLLAGGTLSSLSIFATPVGVAGQTRSFNSSRDLIFSAVFTSGSQGVFAWSAGTGISPVAMKNDIAPGITGTAVRFLAFQNPAINNTGHAAFHATFSGSGVTTANNAGIWAETGTDSLPVLGKVARTGDPAPGRSGSTTLLTGGTFAALGDPVFNNNDALAFIGNLKVAGTVTAANSQGIWTNTSGTMALAVRAQDAAPGCPAGAKFASFAQLVLPDQGGIVFLANLATGTGSVTAANSQGIWAVDPIGQMALVVRTGDVLVLDGKQRVISSVTIFTSSTGTTAQTRSFNHRGDLIYKASFVDGSKAIYNVTFP